MSQEKPTLYVTHDQNEALAMATKIAILNNGQIEQLDTPFNVYHNPQSLFVAQFLGRPQINCLKYVIILLMLLSENLTITDSGLPCRLLAREWLGNTQLLYLDSDEGELRMTIDPSFVCPERIFVQWDKSKVFHFDAKTGQRKNFH